VAGHLSEFAHGSSDLGSEAEGLEQGLRVVVQEGLEERTCMASTRQRLKQEVGYFCTTWWLQK